MGYLRRALLTSGSLSSPCRLRLGAQRPPWGEDVWLSHQTSPQLNSTYAQDCAPAEATPHFPPWRTRGRVSAEGAGTASQANHVAARRASGDKVTGQWGRGRGFLPRTSVQASTRLVHTGSPAWPVLCNLWLRAGLRGAAPTHPEGSRAAEPGFPPPPRRGFQGNLAVHHSLTALG